VDGSSASLHPEASTVNTVEMSPTDGVTVNAARGAVFPPGVVVVLVVEVDIVVVVVVTGDSCPVAYFRS
jgi:hypothetical protein